MEVDDKQCFKCKVDFNADKIIGCEGECAGWYHLKCAKVTEQQYVVIKNCNGIKWFCKKCYEKSEVKVKSDINKINRNIEQLKEIIIKKQAQLDSSNVNKQEQRIEVKTYAEVIKHAPQTIVITAKDGTNMKNTEIMEHVENSVNPTSLAVGVRSIRAIRNKSIAITCDSLQEREMLHKEVEMKLGNQFHVEVPRVMKPRIKIIGLQREFTEQEIKQCILEQNKSLLINKNCEIKLVITKKMKYDFMAIIEVDSNTFEKIMKEGTLKMKWKICKIYIHIHILRCFNCSGYGHKAAECKNKSTCSKCGQAKHTIECTEFQCVNCVLANKKYNLKLNVNHSAYDRSCAVYQRKIEIKMNRLESNQVSQ